jgi:V8-like Glu-specific endopeptidase
MRSVSHRSIGALTFQHGQTWRCAGTGVLISKDLVLTAAHNIYDKDSSLKQKNRSEDKLMPYELEKSSFRYNVDGMFG